MRRLYWRVYAAFVLVVVIFTLMVGALRLLGPDDEGRRDTLARAVAATLAELLPPPGAPAAELESTLSRLAGRFEADATVYAGDGSALAMAGARVPPPPRDGASGWVRDGRARGFALALPDGRWLVAHKPRPRRLRGAWVAVLLALAAAIAIGAYPLARRITRRLERLQSRVEALGSGDLSARVQVEGRDEVAELARAFNAAAERIEGLVNAQRAALAGASHELRSPLARIRMAVELAGDALRPDLRTRVERDVAELDDLIEELLLASRLEAGAAPDADEPVDLLALLAEEGARVGADAGGEAVTVHGSPRLLRRMLRNLLENAERHGQGTPVEARVGRDGDGTVVIQVSDRGPGVPEAIRERIFEPFYRPPGTAEGEGAGVGLGLALVRQVARRHGGDAVCEAREGGGTRITVRLPGNRSELG